MSGQQRDSTSVRGGLACWLAAAASAALLAAALPAVASATDYCVDTSCGGTPVNTLEDALSKAATASDADRIFLGAGTYLSQPGSGFGYHAWGPVEIIGQGEGKTILTSPSAVKNLQVLHLWGAAGTSVHDLTIKLPPWADGQASGLYTNGTARRVDVVGAPPSQPYLRDGVELITGGALEDSTVSFDDSGSTAALLVGAGSAVRHSELSAGTGVVTYGGTIDRSRVAASVYGVEARAGTSAINNSLIRLPGSHGIGIRVVTSSGDSSVNADGVTIVTPDSWDFGGVNVNTTSAPAANADVSLRNAIIRGPVTPLLANAAGSGEAKISASYSDYDTSGDVWLGAAASIDESNVTNVGDAGFVDAAAGDYHLRADSPLVDAGDPATPQGLDLDGNPLVADGNGDGLVRRDLGAFERESVAPAVAGGGAGQPAATASADTQPPVVTGFRAAPSVFAVGPAVTPLAARLAHGTKFRYTLSEDSRVTLTIQRALAGRRSAGKCVRPTAQLAHAKRCTRYQRVGSLSRSAKAGADTTRFSGRLDKRGLRPGSYRALIRATDTAGNRSTPRRAGFRVARS